MAANDDEEALTWAGGRDPSHYETPEPAARKPRKPAKQRATGDLDGAGAAGTATDGTDLAGTEAEAAEPPVVTSSAVLICLGILGGIYALYTVGWFVSWRRLLYSDTDELEFIAFHVQQVLCIIAPALWFGTVLFFTRGHRPAPRLLWLVVGALLLVPWSFTFGQ
ncbi:MAG: hypothetical protein WDM88_10525 [Galbitalea sp.]